MSFIFSPLEDVDLGLPSPAYDRDVAVLGQNCDVIVDRRRREAERASELFL